MAVTKSESNKHALSPSQLKQILRRCSSSFRIRIGGGSSEGGANSVPEGHFAVYIGDGPGRSRHVVPISYLEHPAFRGLLRLAEEEFGFKQEAGLIIPCDEAEFLRLTSSICQHA